MDEIVSLNLCSSCRFVDKCDRYEFLETNIRKIEKEAFKRWGIDAITGFSVEDCDRYKPDPAVVEGEINE